MNEVYRTGSKSIYGPKTLKVLEFIGYDNVNVPKFELRPSAAPSNNFERPENGSNLIGYSRDEGEFDPLDSLLEPLPSTLYSLDFKPPKRQRVDAGDFSNISGKNDVEEYDWRNFGNDSESDFHLDELITH